MHSRGRKELEEASDTGGLLVVPVISEPQGQDEETPAFSFEPPESVAGIRTEADDILSGLGDIEPETSPLYVPESEPEDGSLIDTPEQDIITEPLNDSQQEDETLTHTPEPDIITETPDDIPDIITKPLTDSQSEPESFTDTPQPDIITETPDDIPDIITEPLTDSQPEIITEPSATLPGQQHSDLASITAEDLNDAWHMSSRLNEPPPEMWTNIDEPDEDEDPPDYEPSMSLQGDAYIPVVRHGTNFTQRLQKILQGRRSKAEQRREREEQNKDHHPYFHKALIFCSLLVLTLGFAYAGLWLYHRYTPDYINNKAASLYQQGKFSEALAVYKSGRERYPNILTFLTGIARSAEKAGLTQTARTAWNEYINALPRDDTEHREAAEFELQRLAPAPEPPKPQEVPAKPTTPQRPRLPEVRPVMFDEVLEEANHYHNIGMFSRAIVYFHRAMALRDNDIRPYIGLAAGYRAKGLYFEARRILNEARAKFGRNPTIDTELLFLKGE